MPSNTEEFSVHDLLTVSQAAEVLGITSTTLRNWDKAGKLKPIRHPLNGYRLYRRDDLETLIKQFGSPTEEAR